MSSETPLKMKSYSTAAIGNNSICLPPVSSILLSPAESSMRNSLLLESTPKKSKIDQNSQRKIFLPSIDTLTSSPTLKKSLSYPTTLPLPLPTPSNYSLNHDSFYNKSFIPVTPIHHKLPLAPIFNQSTPLSLPHSNKNNSKLNHLVNRDLNANLSRANNSLLSDSNDYGFVSQTPLRSLSNGDSIRKNIIPTPTPMSNNINDGSKTNNNVFNQSSPIGETSSTSSKCNRKRKASIDDSKSFAFISHSQETFLSNEPDIDNARLARRKRRRTSPIELSILKDEFKKGATPNKQRRINIAKMVDMTEKAVQIWFQNRRQAMRKLQNQNKKEYIYEVSKKGDGEEDELNILENDSEIYDAEEVERKEEEKEVDGVEEEGEERENPEEEKPEQSQISIPSESDENNQEHDSDISMENKENIDPTKPLSPKQKNSDIPLPPSGLFSPTSNKTSQRKEPLSDITNQQVGQVFKFKSTDFGLIKPNCNTSRRQKPTMKLKLKFGLGGSPIMNQNNGVTVLKDSTNLQSESKLKNKAEFGTDKILRVDNRVEVKSEN